VNDFHYTCLFCFIFNMINYFGAFKLWSWKMGDSQINKFADIVTELNWKICLIWYFILNLILTFTPLFLSTSEVVSYTPIIISFLLVFILGIVFTFIGFYFSTAFFKTDLSVFQFFSGLIYLSLPFSFFISLFSIFSQVLLINDEVVLLEYISIVYSLMLIYYAFKILNTSVNLFAVAFETTMWKLVGVVLLWGTLTIPIYYVLGLVLNLFLI
jgi:hypothetical protein